MYLYIIIGLSRWPQGVSYEDGRTDGRAGTSKAGQTEGRADEQADGPNRAKIAHSAILARKLYKQLSNTNAYKYVFRNRICDI